MNFLKSLWCWLVGHRRGQKMERPFSERELGFKSYRCPRCGAEWTRTIRAKKGAA